MHRHSESLLLRDAPRSIALGVLVAAVAVTATTLIIYPLGVVSPAVSLGVVYLLAVLLISTYWGLWLGLLTAVMSAATFNWFHIAPTGRFHVAESQNWVALAVFLAAAVIASTVAGVARSRATEAQRRREEADLAAAMARTLLGGASLDKALPLASRQLADAFGLRFSIIEPTAVQAGVGQVAIPLAVGAAGAASLLVPSDMDESARQRLSERVVPSLEALLAAALDRDRLQRDVVETQALRRSDVLKTALLRAVSHDLRSPLTAIIAAGDAVRSSTIEPAERQELASMITGEAARLSRLVEQLLDLSRLQAGTAEPRRDWCSIEEIVASAIEHLDSGDEAVPIEIAIDHRLPFLEADAAQLERVFVNLLENALRFSNGHPVEVHAREVDGRLAVRVIDRGPGIPKDELPRVFEPFRRGEEHSEHSGSGLGLAIVKGFVEANGGRVRAESHPGLGAVFALDFPLPASAGRPPEARAP
jgi:two-component system, OmpR family, sensor histidine kinase KdpD